MIVNVFNAVKEGDLATLVNAVDNGFDINTKNSDNENILFTAVKYRRYDIVLYLLTLKIDVNLRHVSGQRAYDLAKFYGDKRMIYLFEKVFYLFQDEKK